MKEMLDKLIGRFGDVVSEEGGFRGEECCVVKREAIVTVCQFLRDDLGFAMLTDLCGADYPCREERFEIVYHLYSLEDGKRMRLKIRVPGDKLSVESVCGIWKAANWFEREVYDLFGVHFENHPNLKRILCHHEFEGHPLRKDFAKNKRGRVPRPDPLLCKTAPSCVEGEGDIKTETIFLNMGPSHPAMHGCFRVLLELDGEKIINATPEIGYLHRCFEKEAEDHTYTQVIPYTDRLNYVSPLMNNVGYCMAVEKLMGLDIPNRAKWIRMLVCELSRIMDHLVCVGTNLVDIGALTNYWYFFNVREMIIDWVEALCGARLTTTYTRIGGVVRDCPANTDTHIRNCLKELRRAISDVEGLTKKNRILIDRTRRVGAITKEDAVSYGFTGPCLRATGVDYDVRRAHPYYFYGDLNWDIPVGVEGDTYDRIFVRIEEMRQSARMIGQILEKMTQGPIMVDDRSITLPPKHEVYGTIEGTIAQFKLVTEGLKPQAGEVYSYTEAANGELGFYVVSDGGPKPYRIKVRPPCFAIYQAYPEMIKGHLVADAVAVMGSLNIIAGELDR